MTWNNSDGLFVKFGAEEATVNRGGETLQFGPRMCTEFRIDYTDALSATAAVLGSMSGVTAGGQGILFHSGSRIEAVEVIAETAFTSSGTIGSADLTFGLNRQDRTTAYDIDGFSTQAGSTIDAAGERVYLVPGGTGAGALIGTTLANSGYVVVANTAHASHPFTAGVALVRVYWYTPVDPTDQG